MQTGSYLGEDDIIRLDDETFPKHNPNPDDMEMLHAIRGAVLQHKADLCLGFDGDGDRCSVVDDTGEELFVDKVGVILMPTIVLRQHPEVGAYNQTI